MRNDTCTVTTCEMPVKRKGLCYGHYMKQWRYGDPLHDRVCGPKVDLAGARFGALIVRQYVGSGRWACDCDCGRGHTVRTGNLNAGSVQSCGAKVHQLEDDVEYIAAHDRIYAARGAASGYQCVDCGRQARQWSYDHGDPDELRSRRIKGHPAYSLKIDHYQPRCVPCHKMFDRRP